MSPLDEPNPQTIQTLKPSEALAQEHTTNFKLSAASAKENKPTNYTSPSPSSHPCSSSSHVYHSSSYPYQALFPIWHNRVHL